MYSVSGKTLCRQQVTSRDFLPMCLSPRGPRVSVARAPRRWLCRKEQRPPGAAGSGDWAWLVLCAFRFVLTLSGPGFFVSPSRAPRMEEAGSPGQV